MFICLNLLERNIGLPPYVYNLIDDNFAIAVMMSTSNGSRSCQAILCLIQEYTKRQLPVAANIARMQLSFRADMSWLEFSKTWIDKNFPLLNYGTKYYPCVLRQMKQLSFGTGCYIS